MKVLVVDDEKLLVKGIKFNLEQEGYQVITAFDGEEAVRLAHDESIDIILLDLFSAFKKVCDSGYQQRHLERFGHEGVGSTVISLYFVLF